MREPAAEVRSEPLFLAGAIAALVTLVMTIVPLALVFGVPQPPLSGGAELLRYIGSNKAVYILELATFAGLGLPALVVFLSLAVALKDRDRTLAVVGGVIGVGSEIIALAVNSSPPSLHAGLVVLSDQFAAAATEAGRAALAAAADGLMAIANTVTPAGIMTALAILLLSIAMVRGPFPKWFAWVGVVTGALGAFSEALRNLIGAAYALYGLLLLVWFAGVGLVLFRLSRTGP